VLVFAPIEAMVLVSRICLVSRSLKRISTLLAAALPTLRRVAVTFCCEPSGEMLMSLDVMARSGRRVAPDSVV